MGDALPIAPQSPPTGYRSACNQWARRQGLIDQLLKDAIQFEAMPDAKQPRGDPQSGEE
jgi:hypothetical protein